MIKVNINLTSIPEGVRWKNQKGDDMVTIIVTERREVGQYGETHTAYINQSDEERQKGAPKVYVGRGKEYKFNSQ